MASKRAIRRKACKRKVRHATVQEAKLAIAHLHLTKGWQGHMDAYGCPFCGGYHIGHSKRNPHGPR